jgi:hypothetical protein
MLNDFLAPIFKASCNCINNIQKKKNNMHVPATSLEKITLAIMGFETLISCRQKFDAKGSLLNHYV